MNLSANSLGKQFCRSKNGIDTRFSRSTSDTTETENESADESTKIYSSV